MHEDFYDVADEQDVIDFIRNYLPTELKEKFTDDDLLYLLDLISEYYSEHEAETDEEDENYLVPDEKEMIKFILRESKKDEMGPYLSEDIYFVILGEMEYANSLYEQEEE